MEKRKTRDTHLERVELMRLVSYPAVDLVVLNRVMQLRDVIFVANVSGSCAGDAFYALFLHCLGGWVGIFSHQDRVHLGP